MKKHVVSLQQKKKLRRIHSYLYHKFPVIRTLSTKSILAKISILLFFFLLFAGDIYYAGFVGQFTPNGVFDALAAFPLQAFILFLIGSVIVAIRVIGYKGTSGINYLRGKTIRQCDRSINNHLFFAFPNSTKVSVFLNCSELLTLKEMHPFLKAALRFTVIDKEDLYRLEAGSLDIPKASLIKIELTQENNLILHLTSVSFYDIFFTHYFADYHLSSERYDENRVDSNVTLRTIFHNDAYEYICNEIKSFKNGEALNPYPLFPNPLGVTGICRFMEGGEFFYIRRYRKSDVINETNSLDWSFSGLVEAHTLLDSKNSCLPLCRYYINELEDEVFSQFCGQNIQVDSDNFLGLLFSEKFLLQPEIVVLVTLKNINVKLFEGKKTLYNLISHSDIISEAQTCCESESYRKKDIYVPVLHLLRKALT